MNDIVCFEVLDINPSGITIKNKNSEIFVCFEECARNYANEKSLEANKCIATRNITKLTFTFYTDPKSKVVFKKHFIRDLLSGKSAVSRFLELQKAINKYGYTSYDLS